MSYTCLDEKTCSDMEQQHAKSCQAYNAVKDRVDAHTDHNDFDEYGKWVKSRWFSHPGTDADQIDTRNLAIMSLGIAGEAGEVAEKMKKVIRDGTIDKPAILKELGDVVFYACMIADTFGFRPSQILAANVEKIEGRAQRGTQRGSGDDR